MQTNELIIFINMENIRNLTVVIQRRGLHSCKRNYKIGGGTMYM